MGRLQAVLFDLDGTLTDSAEIVAQGMQEMYLAQTGKLLPRESFYKYLGPPLSWSFADLGAKPAQIEQWLQDYRQRYLQKMPFTPLFPGIRQMLHEIQQLGCHLAVATSKLTQYAQEVCEYTKIAQYFTNICGASADGSRETKALVIESALEALQNQGVLSAPAQTDSSEFRDDVVMVGDRIYDIAGAQEHRIRTILVGWGKAPAAEQQAAWQVVQTPAELTQLLQEIAK